MGSRTTKTDNADFPIFVPFVVDELKTDYLGYVGEHQVILTALHNASQDCDRIVTEANAAFGMNMKMFQELEGNLIKAIGIMLFNTLTRRRTTGSTETGLATAE